MKKQSDNQLIGTRTFSFSDQVNFANYSGDINPIHLNKQEARKTISGACVVHGIHSFLWSLECLVSNSDIFFYHYHIRFLKPVFVEQTVFCFWNEEQRKLIVSSEDNIILVSINCNEVAVLEDLKKTEKKFFLQERLEAPIDVEINDLTELTTFELRYGGDKNAGEKIVPELKYLIGESILYEIAILSNIVGMQIPGMYSLFAQCKINLKGKCSKPNYQLTKVEKELNFLKIDYGGINIRSTLTAFVRPQAPTVDTCEAISKQGVKFYDLSGLSILIVGGSRGLGAWVAKCLALSGASVTITYMVSEHDALDICKDIKRFCKIECKTLQFDVINSSPTVFRTKKYDHFYYFATPKIFGESSLGFDDNLHKLFFDCYCDSFKMISKNLITQGVKKIFYPSTISIEQPLKELEEYTLAKLEGEKICKQLASEYPVDVIWARLDRVRTDQTISIIPIKSLDPLTVAMDIVNQMITSKHGKSIRLRSDQDTFDT